MILTVVGEHGEESVHSFDVDAATVVGDLCGIIAAEVGAEIAHVLLFHNGDAVSDHTKTLSECGIGEASILTMRRRAAPVEAGAGALGRTSEDVELERVRQSILNDASVRDRLMEVGTLQRAQLLVPRTS